MPPLTGATEWHNTEPLGPADLRGHIVLVNFWTLTCINWLRQAPHVRAWARAYRDDGLIVIGVHTPEFSFEHIVENIREAIADRDIDYPVVIDNDYAIWSAFANHYWPALYVVDSDGVIQDQYFGEGRYEQSERVVQELLGINRTPAVIQAHGVEANADWPNLRTPERSAASSGASANDDRRLRCFGLVRPDATATVIEGCDRLSARQGPAGSAQRRSAELPGLFGGAAAATTACYSNRTSRSAS